MDLHPDPGYRTSGDCGLPARMAVRRPAPAVARAAPDEPARARGGGGDLVPAPELRRDGAQRAEPRARPPSRRAARAPAPRAQPAAARRRLRPRLPGDAARPAADGRGARGRAPRADCTRAVPGRRRGPSVEPPGRERERRDLHGPGRAGAAGAPGQRAAGHAPPPGHGAAHRQPRRVARPPARAAPAPGRAHRGLRAGPPPRRAARLPVRAAGAGRRAPRPGRRLRAAASAPRGPDPDVLQHDRHVRHPARHHARRARDRVVLPRRPGDGSPAYRRPDVGAAVAGLSEAEAAARRQAGHGNTASVPTGRTYGAIVRENVFTFVNDVLFLLGLALVVVGRPLDALISVGVILANVVISVAQEVRAKRTLDRIALLTRPLATVVRDGSVRELAPEELVLGDRLRASPGDQIVLDGRVLEGAMQVDESLLTGESDLVAKGPGDEVFSGSFCVTGAADYEVERVGADSLANRMTAGARGFRRILTPIQREINAVIRITLLIVLYMELLLILRSLLTLVSMPESIAQATVLAGLVPNGLFLSIAVAYAVGAVCILRFGALVQQSNAIESLSNVDVLCLDKTGTLTANALRVRSIEPLGASEEELRSALGAIAASTTAPNQTSEAIAAAFPRDPVATLEEVPFSSARKWSALAFSADGLTGVYALGAPEMLRPFADGGDGVDWRPIEERIRQSAEQGLRVLLAVHSPHEGQLRGGDTPELPSAMRPLGLVVLADELRPEAAETLAAFARLDVQVKVISGDNPETVAALVRQAGLPPSGQVRTGAELASLTSEELSAAAEQTSVFGRVTPEQKEALVASLRRRHYVAMIGDGVNDVLSLKGANLAVAMQSGSQATRGVADLILTNDSFASLVPALTEGQRIV